jgi:hypothetical protein
MTFESHNPATGELIGTYPEHDEAETAGHEMAAERYDMLIGHAPP